MCLGSPFLQGSPVPRTVPCWPGVCLFAFSFPLCLCSRPLISPLLCSSVSVLTPAPGGLASLLSPCAVSRELVGVEARSGVCDQARKENPSRHDIYVETSKWSPGCGGGGWGLASKSQTEVSSCSSPVRVSLVIHTSPVGHQTQSRDGTGYFGAEFQERHFLYPHPAPIFFPVTLQLILGSLVPPPLVRIPQLGIQGVWRWQAGAKDSISARKHPRHWGSLCIRILTFWQRLRLAGQHGSVTLSAPRNGTRQVWPFPTFRVQLEPGGFKKDCESHLPS